MAEYLWTDLLAEYGTTEAAWAWLRQNAKQEDILHGGSQELLDLLWQEGLISSNYAHISSMGTSPVIPGGAGNGDGPNLSLVLLSSF